jgi:hypothetical protein
MLEIFRELKSAAALKRKEMAESAAREAIIVPPSEIADLGLKSGVPTAPSVRSPVEMDIANEQGHKRDLTEMARTSFIEPIEDHQSKKLKLDIPK